MLKIADWPPLASHLAFLLFGVSLANYYGHQAPQRAQLVKNQSLLYLPSGSYEIEGDEGLLAVKMDKERKQALCREELSSLAVLREGAGIYVRVAAAQLVQVSAFLQSKEHKFTNKHFSLPLCVRETLVRYGL